MKLEILEKQKFSFIPEIQRARHEIDLIRKEAQMFEEIVKKQVEEAFAWARRRGISNE